MPEGQFFFILVIETSIKHFRTDISFFDIWLEMHVIKRAVQVTPNQAGSVVLYNVEMPEAHN